jgi:hypothetical protein
MNKRQQRIERILAVEREYQAATAGVDLLKDSLRADPRFGAAQGWRSRDARNLEDNLEGTFLLRLYAEFEAGLRDVWKSYFGRDTHPPMKDLLVAIANQRIPQDWLEDADAVREYRNALVHEGDTTDIEAVSLAEARSRLCRFFSQLPKDW